MKFDKLTYIKAIQLLGRRIAGQYRVNRAYYDGKHYDGGGNPGSGDGWVGPLPPSSDPSFATVVELIRKNFVFHNVTREIVDRHTGTATTEPIWKYTTIRALEENEKPTAEEQKLIYEAETLMQDWFDKRMVAHANDVTSHPVHDAIVMMLLSSRSLMRLFVPPDEIIDGLIPDSTIEEALEKIFIHVPDYYQAAEYLDLDSQRKVGIYRYQFEQDEENSDKEAVELAYRDGKETVIRIVSNGEDTGMTKEIRLNLGGNSTMYEMRRPPLFGDSFISLQRALNMNLTMLTRNQVLGGFVERTVLNAKLPDPLYVGAGTTTSLIGVEIINQDGKRELAQPDIRWRDPVPVDTFQQAHDMIKKAMLEEGKQAHLITITSDRTSGVARRVAMTDYIKDLILTASQVVRAYRWILETVLRMAAIFAGDPTRFDSIRPAVDVYIAAEIDEPELMRVIMDLANAKIISHSTALARLGVIDVDGELARILIESKSPVSPAGQTPVPGGGPEGADSTLAQQGGGGEFVRGYVRSPTA